MWKKVINKSISILLIKKEGRACEAEKYDLEFPWSGMVFLIGNYGRCLSIFYFSLDKVI